MFAILVVNASLTLAQNPSGLSDQHTSHDRHREGHDHGEHGHDHDKHDHDEHRHDHGEHGHDHDHDEHRHDHHHGEHIHDHDCDEHKHDNQKNELVSSYQYFTILATLNLYIVDRQSDCRLPKFISYAFRVFGWQPLQVLSSLVFVKF